VLLKYRDRVTSRYHNDRGRRHGRNENEKSLGFTTQTQAFLSRLDCHAFEQIIWLYVDSILEQSIAIKQIAAYLKVAC
jgi:hypothetical protein